MIKFFIKYYLLDKNVTSRIREVIQFYEKEFKRPFNKKTGFSKRQLQLLADKQWDSLEDKKYYELIVGSYKKLKGIDLENVLLYPFFCIIESLFQRVKWDQYNQLTTLEVDRKQVSQVVKEELAILDQFFTLATRGEMPIDIEGQIMSFFDKNNNELLFQQNANLNEILYINHMIEDFKARDNGKIIPEARRRLVEEIKERFKGPSARIYRLTLLLALYDEQDSVSITKIQRNSRKFSVYNYFFDMFFITKIFDLSILVEKINFFLRYQSIQYPYFKRSVSYLTFDEPLHRFIKQHLNTSLIVLKDYGRGFLVEIKASSEIQRKPYFKEIEFLFSNRF